MPGTRAFGVDTMRALTTLGMDVTIDAQRANKDSSFGETRRENLGRQ